MFGSGVFGHVFTIDDAYDGQERESVIKVNDCSDTVPSKITLLLLYRQNQKSAWEKNAGFSTNAACCCDLRKRPSIERTTGKYWTPSSVEIGNHPSARLARRLGDVRKRMREQMDDSCVDNQGRRVLFTTDEFRKGTRTDFT
jgi:hypothetical protein